MVLIYRVHTSHFLTYLSGFELNLAPKSSKFAELLTLSRKINSYTNSAMPKLLASFAHLVTIKDISATYPGHLNRDFHIFKRTDK